MAPKTKRMTPMDNNGDEKLMSIGQLADLSGVSTRTVRYYEELGILPPPPRTTGGTRKYPPEYRFFLEGAQALKEIGFTLDEIKLISRLTLGQRMSEGRRREALQSIREKMETLEHKIRVLTRLRDLFHEKDVDRGDPAAIARLVAITDGTKRTRASR